MKINPLILDAVNQSRLDLENRLRKIKEQTQNSQNWFDEQKQKTAEIEHKIKIIDEYLQTVEIEPATEPQA